MIDLMRGSSQGAPVLASCKYMEFIWMIYIDMIHETPVLAPCNYMEVACNCMEVDSGK